MSENENAGGHNGDAMFAPSRSAAPPLSAGEQLRAAREAAGRTVDNVAAETRISNRFILALENGDYQALPARTYALGFSRTYAKVLGLDPARIAAAVRQEMAGQGWAEEQREDNFEPGDPARLPSRSLAWVATLAAIIFLAGLFFAGRALFFPAAELPPVTQAAEEQPQADAVQPGADAATPAGPVVFTAVEEGIWVRFYDGEGQRLHERIMAQGESYTVPAEAVNPQIWTGRPEALDITIGGQPVPRLSDSQRTMRDVPVDAAALLARESGQALQPGTAPAPAAPGNATADQESVP